MTYIPHEWESNELITHQKLNHMEDNIGKCVAVIDVDYDPLNETHEMLMAYKDIKALADAKAFIMGAFYDGDEIIYYPVTYFNLEEDETYVITCINGFTGQQLTFVASSIDDHPHTEGQN